MIPIRLPMSDPATTSYGWCLWSTSLEMAQARARTANTAWVTSLRGMRVVSLLWRYTMKKAAQQSDIWECPEGKDLMESVSRQSSPSSNVDRHKEGSNVTKPSCPPQ